MTFYYDNQDYDDQLKRTAAAIYSGAADLGEIMVAAAAAMQGDAGSWYEQWSAAAMRAEALAETAGLNCGP